MSAFADQRIIVHFMKKVKYFCIYRQIIKPNRRENMHKKEEKTPIPWEAKDPKPPVVRSGHMENRIRH